MTDQLDHIITSIHRRLQKSLEDPSIEIRKNLSSSTLKVVQNGEWVGTISFTQSLMNWNRNDVWLDNVTLQMYGEPDLYVAELKCEYTFDNSKQEFNPGAAERLTDRIQEHLSLLEGIRREEEEKDQKAQQKRADHLEEAQQILEEAGYGSYTDKEKTRIMIGGTKDHPLVWLRVSESGVFYGERISVGVDRLVAVVKAVEQLVAVQKD